MSRKWAQLHQPCPCGKSSDAYAIREDGSGFCFSGGCEEWKKFNNNTPQEEEIDEDLENNFEFRVMGHRGIRSDVFNKFNVQTKINQGVPESVGFIYPKGSRKIRVLEEKKIFSVGAMGQETLYLKNYFDKASKNVITITEGEYDALAVIDILGEESAVVSIKSAATAVSDCKAEWEYINSFNKIVVNFDNDEAGQLAAKKVLGLFDFKKTYNLVLDRHKDANGYLYDNETKKEVDDRKAYYNAWKGAKRHTPDNIVSGNSAFREALRQNKEACIATYPFEFLQQKLYGIHRGEVIIIKAEEGIGKTEVFRAIEDHILKTTKIPIGVIHLEEDNGTTLRGMAAYYSDTPIHIPEATASEDDIMDIIEEINGQDEGRIFLRSAFDVDDEDAFINGIRFLVSVCGCGVVLLDHISWLATGEDNQDERKKLDRIATRLKLLAKELSFALIMISHINDEGKTRGSRYITKVANTVIHLSRDKMHPDEVERNKTFFGVEKARLSGSKTGPAGFAMYDTEKNMLKDPSKIV